MAEPANIFRVKIHLHHFFADHKSKAYVSVNRQWKNVRQFHRHISDIFDVKKFVLVTSDGIYLPPNENIGIIEAGDEIHVKRKSDDSESSACAVSEIIGTLTERNVDKYLQASDAETFKDPNNISRSVEIISGIESIDTNDTTSTPGSKRKRVRHRKKKQCSVVSDENQMNAPNVRGGAGILKADLTAKPKFDEAPKKSNTHVRFEEDELLSELDEEIVLPKKARIIRANIIGETKLSVEPIEEIQKDKNKENGTECHTSTEIIQLNGSAVEDKGASSEKQQPALEHLAQNLETIGKYKDMENNVKEMDMIAFKVFMPNFEKSDYVIGLVESIIGRQSSDQNDYDLTFLIMAGNSHIEHLSAPTADEEEVKRIQINRMDIFDAKTLEL